MEIPRKVAPRARHRSRSGDERAASTRPCRPSSRSPFTREQTKRSFVTSEKERRSEEESSRPLDSCLLFPRSRCRSERECKSAETKPFDDSSSDTFRESRAWELCCCTTAAPFEQLFHSLTSLIARTLFGSPSIA